MRIVPFEMERWQSTWENVVEYNLAESGVEPLPLSDLLRDPEQVRHFLGYRLAYSATQGTPELRALISAMYPESTADHVLVTNGSSEGILLATWHLVEPGDEVVVMVPNYMEVWGLAQMFGAHVKPLRLREELGWQFDPEDVKDLVTRRTKLIAVCNPNSPTGAVMDATHRRTLLDVAEDAGAWLLSDEVYLGAEREAPRTESLWGGHESVIITSGLSKAYGLPGLRIGWLVGSPRTIATLWGYHDYTSIAPTYLSDRLAQIALEPARREELLDRAQTIVRHNFPVVRDWIDGHTPWLTSVPPKAGAIWLVRYGLPMNSTALAERLLKEKSTLVVPGDHFGVDGHVRIGFGVPSAYLQAGLRRIGDLFDTLTPERGPRRQDA